MGFRHLLWYTGTAYISAYVSGQMGMVEPNKKMSIGRSKTEMSEWSGADQNNRIKIEKGAILSHPPTSGVCQIENAKNYQFLCGDFW
jgi:hypothetical protein